MNLVAYTRVSTDRQGDSGLGLEAQRRSIEAYAQAMGHTIVEWVDDVQSGKSIDRPGIARCLEMLANRSVSGLIVAKLDRLSRSMRDFTNLVERFQRERYTLIVVQESIDLSTAVGSMLANILMAFAEFERATISERTKRALAVAKSRGVMTGPKPYADEGMVARVIRDRDVGMSYQQISADTGLTIGLVRKILARENKT